MGFVHDWQKALGYHKDPFVEVPSKSVEQYFVDREAEREKLNLFIIKRHRFGTISGPKGSGKTALLCWLQQELTKHRHKTIMLTGKILEHRKPFFDYLLNGTLHIIEKTVTRPHEKLKKDEVETFLLQKLRKRHVIFLVDEAQLLIKENKELLKTILRECPESQVLLVLERVLKEHAEWGKDELAMELGGMGIDALKQLIGKRIALAGGVGIHPFSNAELEGLIAKVKQSPVKLLVLARERAIELSLKAGPPPKTRPTPPEKTSKAARRREVPTPKLKKQEDGKSSLKSTKAKKRWFSLRIVNDWAEKAGKDDPAAADSAPDHEMLDESLLEPRGEAKLDADMLNDLIASNENDEEISTDEIEIPVNEEKHGRKNDRKKDEIEVEDVIESLVQELDKKER